MAGDKTLEKRKADARKRTDVIFEELKDESEVNIRRLAGVEYDRTGSYSIPDVAYGGIKFKFKFQTDGKRDTFRGRVSIVSHDDSKSVSDVVTITEVEAVFFTFMEDTRPMVLKRFMDSMKVSDHKSILKPLVVTHSSTLGKWIIGYETFDDHLDIYLTAQSTPEAVIGGKSGKLSEFWREMIKKVYEMLSYVHDQGLTHGDMGNPKNYVVHKGDVKVIWSLVNLKPATNDLVETCKFFLSLINGNSELKELLNLTLFNNVRIDNIINHPCLMDSEERLNCFHGIQQDVTNAKYKERLQFQKELTTECGSVYKWRDAYGADQNVIFDKIFDYEFVTYNPECPISLLFYLRNVRDHYSVEYRCEMKEISYEDLDLVLSQYFPLFLCKIFNIKIKWAIGNVKQANAKVQQAKAKAKQAKAKAKQAKAKRT